MVGRILDNVYRTMAYMAAGLLILLVPGIVFEVCRRFFGYGSTIGFVEANEYAILWITILAAPWVLKEEGHVVVDILLEWPRLGVGKNLLIAIASGVSGGSCLVISYFGGVAVYSSIQEGVQEVSALRLPKAPIISVIPIGFFLLCVEFARRTQTYFKLFGAKKERQGKASDM
jgi:TRAP-type C4-dicarboxylate transport system permease small subunit